jgi:hypothetical protein
MRNIKILVYFLAFMIVASISLSFETESSNYKQSLTTTTGGKHVTSSSYQNYVSTGTISSIVESSSYINQLGFFYTWLLADNQACTLNGQCQGGFCCGNLCKSSSCSETTTIETTSSGGDSGGEGGGGGGGLFTRDADYTLSVQNIKAKLALGESDQETIVITNIGGDPITISLGVEGVEEYVSLSDTAVGLDLGEELELTLNFIGRQVGGFVGQIITKSGEVIKSIPVIIEVISKLVLFDVQLDIPTSLTEIEPGDQLKTQITLLNVGAPEKVDVAVAYFIKDLKGNVVYEETETFPVEKQTSYTKSFDIDKNIELGSYVVIVEVRYVDSFAVSSQFFTVVEKKGSVMGELITKNAALMIFITFILIVVIAGLGYNLRSIYKKRKSGKKE